MTERPLKKEADNVSTMYQPCEMRHEDFRRWKEGIGNSAFQNIDKFTTREVRVLAY